MLRFRIATALAAVALTAACGPEVADEYEPDVERLCNAWCDLEDGCGVLFPSPDRDACVDRCFAEPGWEDGCNQEYEARRECQVALTCEELNNQSAFSELPWDQQPCIEEREEHDLCIPEDG